MNGDHKRNTPPMFSSRRCGAKTRSGRPCNSPSVRGKTRCRMHGGAMGSGAPRDNQNDAKVWFSTVVAIVERKRLRNLMCESHKLLLLLDEAAKRAIEDD